jgi:hypothetical protein
LVLDELGECVAVGAEGEAGEPQVLALPRPEPLPAAEDGTAQESDGDDRRHGERSIHLSPPPTSGGPDVCRALASTTTTAATGRRRPAGFLPLPFLLYEREAWYEMAILRALSAMVFGGPILLGIFFLF